MNVSLLENSVRYRVPIQMMEANFRTIQQYKSPKIMTYSSIIYGLLTRIRQQKKLWILNCLCPS